MADDMETKQNFRPKANSVTNQLALVKEVSATPSTVASPLWDTLIEAFQSQGSFAALELPERGIVAMSLNTQKTIAEQVLEGGYATLNDYRKAALVSMNEFKIRSDKPGRGTLDWYKSELAERTAQLERQVNEVALMSLRLDDILALAGQMAIAAGKEKEFTKYRNEIIRKFPA